MIDKLHYISQQPENGSHLTVITHALEAGAKWVQLRVKDQPADVILEYAIEAKRQCNQHGAKLIVNDYPEIALKVGAYGVHLGLEDMPVSRARGIVGNKMIIGGTANTIGHVEQRIAEGADYIGLGPYRFTTTKKKLSPILGWEGISAIMRKLGSVNIPIIAIGGILPQDIKLIMETGVHGVAVSGAITHTANRAEVVKQMYYQLNAPSLNPIVKA
jgi:thiamine-phosphate pyrophosphorylase